MTRQFSSTINVEESMMGLNISVLHQSKTESSFLKNNTEELSRERKQLTNFSKATNWNMSRKYVQLNK